MVRPICVVLQRCAQHNAECCAYFFASNVHLPSNGISCFHLSCARNSVAMSTQPNLGADHDVTCLAHPMTPIPPFSRRPIWRSHGSQHALSAALRHFFFIIVVCCGPTTAVRCTSAFACFGANRKSAIRPRALSRLLFPRKDAKCICLSG